jgi:hypothetical protein
MSVWCGVSEVRDCLLLLADAERGRGGPAEGGPRPVGAENSVTSRDLHVFVYEAAEPISSQRPNGRLGGRRSAARRRELME